jgi:transcriptional regulator with XRE-family HTH domain
MDRNAFGRLVRSCREQRGWTQEELAGRLGFSRVYISQIERGKRKLDKQEHIRRLASVLGISQEQLSSVGKPLYQGKERIQSPLEGDDILLQALLEPAQNTVKMSWLIWQGDGGIIDIESSLQDLVARLDDVLTSYRGQFVRSALRIQAYAHEMLGKLAIERIKTKEAIYHFQEMYDIGEELNDSDLLALALIHQSEMLRRAHRFEASLRRMGAAERYIQKHTDEVTTYIQVMLWKACAINSFVFNDEAGFLRAIDYAATIVDDTKPTVDTLNNEVDKVEILQLRAHGYTQLKQPEKALEIYQLTDTLRPFRLLRDQSSYHIVKAQAHCHAGNIKTGIEHAMAGMVMAESFHSVRYVIRLRQMSDRLMNTQIGKERTMKELRKEILGTLERMNQ